MKKLSFMMMAAALVFGFTSCDKDKDKNLDNIVENGFYVAVGDQLDVKNQFAAGLNEVGQTQRAGMYEKYIVLEADKEFQFIKKEGDSKISYGATLTYGDDLIVTDNQNIKGYKGSLAENTPMKVNETALYHIVLDFNEDGSLTNVGGAQVILVPVEWGIRGAMNGWGFTAADDVKEEAGVTTYTWSEVTVETAGAFKFAHNDCWKINLDDAELVKANTNLGEGAIVGGADIPVERAKYKITLTYTLAQGDIANSYKYNVEKTGELEVLDPSTFVYSFIGTVNGNWDTDTDFAFVSNTGNHYVFEAKGLNLAAGEFKIRFGHDWAKNFGFGQLAINGVEVSDNGGNIVLAAPFTGSAKLEYDWNGSAEENISLTFTAE